MKYYNNTYINNILIDNIDVKYLYHYLYIISYIRTYRFKDRRYIDSDYVPMNIDILRKILIFNKATSFVKDLIDLEIIETDNIFSRKNGTSRGYRLTEKARKEKFYLCTETDEKLDNKIKKVYDNLKFEIIKEDRLGYGFVTECMEHLEIDHENAIKETKNLSGHRRDVAELAIENFSDKFFSKDTTGNRLHNNLTNINTELRKYITYDGEQLFQCDIRNSQLVFLYNLMTKYHMPSEEMNKFKSVVCDFGFYEFFAEKLGVELTKENRKEFKTDIFEKALFSTVKTKLSKTEVIFKQEFPMIFYMTRKLKQDCYKDLAIILQKEESQFIFDCVRKINRKVPIVTIHDSIVSTVGNENLVLNVMQELFKERFNISPKIVVEKFAQVK